MSLIEDRPAVPYYATTTPPVRRETNREFARRVIREEANVTVQGVVRLLAATAFIVGIGEIFGMIIRLTS